MAWVEVNAILEANYNRYKDSWEQTRWLGYINACVAGSSIKKPTDLILFAWEEKELIDTRTPEEKELQIIEDTRTREESIKELLDFASTIKM